MYDELVKRLRSRAGAFDYDGRPDIACDYEQAADAIEQLSAVNERQLLEIAVLSKPRWIPVTERLPGGRDSVLALTGDCDIYVCDYIPSVKQFWTIPGDELHIDDITHWMPLPEPPKEET